MHARLHACSFLDESQVWLLNSSGDLATYQRLANTVAARYESKSHHGELKIELSD